MSCNLCHNEGNINTILCDLCVLRLNIATTEQVSNLITALENKEQFNELSVVKKFLGIKSGENLIDYIKANKVKSNLARKRHGRSPGSARFRKRT